jgi:hypothetical protein
MPQDSYDWSGWDISWEIQERRREHQKRLGIACDPLPLELMSEPEVSLRSEQECTNCSQVASIDVSSDAGRSGHYFFCQYHHPDTTSKWAQGIRGVREWIGYAKTCRHYAPIK